MGPMTYGTGKIKMCVVLLAHCIHPLWIHELILSSW